MPKRIKPLSSKWSDAVLRRCVDKAGRAAAKKRQSPLNDGDFLFLAELVCYKNSMLFGSPLTDENGKSEFVRGRHVSPEWGQTLAWIFYRDTVGAARALEAAHKELSRINITPIWVVRRVIRHLSIIKRMPLECAKMPFDVQRISEEVKKASGFNVTTKLIHKAFREERDYERAQTT